MDGGSLKTRFSGSGQSSNSSGAGGRANGGAGSGGVTLRMGHIYLVMEYVDHDLAGLIDAKVRPPSRPPSSSSFFQFCETHCSSPLPPYLPLHRSTEARIKCLVKQTLDGLNYMHERELVHRDRKYSNLLSSHSSLPPSLPRHRST